MKCQRHKTTELESGKCPECGWAPTGKADAFNGHTHTVTCGPDLSLLKPSTPTLSAVTMTDGKNSTTTEWVETKPRVIKTKPGIILPKETKKKGRK